MWSGNRKQLTPRFAFHAMFYCCRPEDDVRRWIGSDELHLAGNFFWQQVVIRIQVLQPVTARKLKQPVPCHVTATVWARFPANSIAETFDDLETCISRSIIKDDHLFFRPGLRECAFDRLRDPALGVKAGNKNRN